jgi:hypothetical protein
MKSHVLALCILAVAPFAEAQHITAKSGVVINGTSIEFWGEATYFNAAGARVPTGMSGNLTLFEQYADGPADVVDWYPWETFTGAWSDSQTYSGYDSTCYASSAEAQANDTALERGDSGWGCTRTPSGPRESHGFDICPLIIDLEGNGVATSGAEDAVRFFDTNGDGVREPSGWTRAQAEDAFVWMDRNGNGVADPGELFGSTMPLRDGSVAHNGFQALSVYDRPEYGGNMDGFMTPADAIWDRLRLWVDRDHDGVSDPREISTPGANQILSFDLHAVHTYRVDDRENALMYVSRYERRLVGAGGPPRDVERPLVDIAFIPLQPPQ